MAKMLIADGVISSSADYSLFHGTTKVADINQNEIRVQGDIIAENYIVSSSISYRTSSFASGSTIFGDSADDTHQFTGSLSISGSNGVFINQDANAIALNIDHEGTNQQAINVSATNTTGDAVNIDADSLTTANALRVASNSTSTGTRNVMLVHNDHASANMTTALKIVQDAPHVALDIDSANTADWAVDIHGNSITTAGILYAYSNASNTSTRNLVEIHNDHASATGATGLMIKQDSTGPAIVTEGGGYAISGSLTSTASFGKLIGDGSSLTGVGDATFPFTGDAVIKGDFTVENPSGGADLISASIAGRTVAIGDIGNAENYTQFVIDDVNTKIYSPSTDTKFGIGTSSPINGLHVKDGNILIEKDSDTAGHQAILYFKADSQDTAARRKGAIIFQRRDSYGVGDMFFCVDAAADGGDAGTGDAIMYLSGSGNVGINTDNPNLVTYGTNAKVLTILDEGSAGDYGAIEIAGYRTNDGLIGDLNFLHTDGSSTVQARGIIRGIRDGANDAVGLTFFTEATGDSVSEKMRIDSAGNVGINKTSLSKTLHVDSNIGSAGTPNGIMMTNTIHGSNSKIYMYAENDSGASKNSAITLDPDAETMAIDYNGNAITVDSSGNLGIGTTSPDTALMIRGNFDGSSGFNNTNPNKGLNISKYTGAGSDYGVGDIFGITFTAASDSDTDYAFAGVYGEADAVSTYVGGNIVFATRTASESALTEKLRITSDNKISGSVSSTGSFGQLKLKQNNVPANPSINFGDGDSGFYEASDDVIRVAIAGGHSYEINSAAIKGNASNRFGIQLVTPTATLPTFTPNTTDSDTGIGWAAANELSLVAGGESTLIITSRKISGSLDSTGSFGRVEVEGTMTAGAFSPTTLTGVTNIETQYITASKGALLASSATVGPVAINGHVSGSAKSTGSFGRLHINGGVLKLDSNSRISLGNNDASGATSNTIFGYLAGAAITTGAIDNVLIGNNAGNDITTGDYNIAIGSEAMSKDDVGRGSIAIGASALGKQNTASETMVSNIGIGLNSGHYNVTGKDNVYIGSNAGLGVDGESQDNNIGIGSNSLKSLTSGDGNVAIGRDSGEALTGGGYGVMLGYQAGEATTGTSYHVLIGTEAGMAGDITNHGAVAIGYRALKSLTSGGYNTAVGYQSLLDNTTGAYNTAVGYNSLANTTSSYNTAVGYASLITNVDGVANTALGNEALYANRDTNNNTGLGYQSGYYTSGADNTYVGYAAGKGASGAEASNVAVGKEALTSISTGTRNIAIGYDAAKALTSANRNVAIGYEAMRTEDADGDRCVALGYQALYSQNGTTEAMANTGLGYQTAYYNATGIQNVYVGYQAGVGSSGYSNSNNVGIGYRALYLNRTGTENVSIGKDSMRDATTSDGTVAVGAESLYNVTSGNNNVGLGKQALYYITTGAGNVAVGLKALKYNTANNNVAVGTSAMENNTTGLYNVAMGYEALLNAAELDQNTAIGYEALKAMSGSSADPLTGNTAVGYQAGLAVTTGMSNTIVGTNAGDAITTGNSNILMGRNAGGAIIGGSNNICFGDSAGDAITDGTYNVAIGGNGAGGAIVGGDGNVAIGGSALEQNQTGDYCIGIGYNSGQQNTGAHHNIAIGYAANDNTGPGNIGIGRYALSGASSGEYNVAIGYDAGAASSTGQSNVFIGANAANAATDIDEAVVIGRYALKTAEDNNHDGVIAIGAQALEDLNVGGGNGTTAVGYQAGHALTTAVNNTLLGRQALKTSTTSSGSVMLGKSAGEAITTGNQNIAIGLSAMNAPTTGDNNIAIGTSAGDALTSGYHNIFMGLDSGKAVSTGLLNIGIGRDALKAVTTGNGIVAVGHDAISVGDPDSDTAAFGNGALMNAAAGSLRNTGLGHQAGSDHTTGDDCVYVGTNTGMQNRTGDRNTYVGSQAGEGVDNNSNSYNTAVGYKSLHVITTGQLNTAAGQQSGEDLTTGGHNALFGADAGASLTVASQSVFIGSQAGTTPTTGNSNIGIGYDAMSGATTTGDHNIAIGVSAGDALTTGHSNVAVGKDSQGGNSNGQYNTSIGHHSMLVHDGGLRNVAIGAFAMDDTDAGSTSAASDDCVFIGYSAGGGTWANQDCSNCIGIGTSALAGALAGNTADGTIAIGTEALVSLSSGEGNLAIGYSAADSITNGNFNVAIGYESLITEDAGSSNTAIGYKTLRSLNNNTGLNTAVGAQAGLSMTTGYLNTLIGNDAGKLLTTSTGNVVVGARALDAADGGESDNIVLGTDAMGSVNNDKSDSNIAMGLDALTGGTGGVIHNIAIGQNALNSTGANNVTGSVAIGYNALTAVTSGILNVAIGYTAGDAITTGLGNVALGYEALSTAQAVTYATAIGAGALGDGNVTADANGVTAVGLGALKALTSGGGNVAVGAYALDGITTSAQNTAVGYNALTACGDSYSNTAVGYQAGDSITNSGAFNICIGTNADVSTGAAENQIVIGRATTGVSNNSVTLGNSAVTDVYMSSDKDAMVHCGSVSGSNGSTGSFSALGIGKTFSDLYLGTKSIHTKGYIDITGNGGLSFNDNSSTGFFYASNIMTLSSAYGTAFKTYTGSSYVERMRIAGNQTNTLVYFSGDNQLISGSVTSTGSFGRIEAAGIIAANNDVIAFASSDERLKDNIKIIENPIEKVEQLRGVEFQWNGLQNAYASGSFDSGIIAQDVQKVLPQIVKEKNDGYLGVRQERLVGLLIEGIKEQQKQIDELKLQIKEIKHGSS